MKKRIIFDTHNILKAERWVPAGFSIFTIGTGQVKSIKAVPTKS